MATRPDFSSLNVPPNGPAIGAAVMQWITEAHEIAVGSTLPATGDFVGQLGAVSTGTSLRVKVWTGSAWADLGDRIDSAAIDALVADTSAAVSSASGWGTPGTGADAPTARKVGGWVQLSGLIGGGAIDPNETGITIGTVPSGYRPSRALRNVLGRTNTTGNRFGTLDITTAGAIVIGTASTNPGPLLQVWLDHIPPYRVA